ncbi:MAG: DNA polymerase III subunit gamma/tau [Archangium sp.]|nr:DNA polymerase III subunit gamma/tau [Archangium sp.]
MTSAKTSPSAPNGTPAVEVKLINRVLPSDAADAPVDDERLFAPEGSAEGCASGECLPEQAPPKSDTEQWKAAVEALRIEAPRHGKSLSYARVLGFTKDGVRIAFPAEAAFHRNTVLGMGRSIIEQALAKHFGRPMKVLEESGGAATESAPKSIAEVEASTRQAREQGIDAKVRQHPAVRNVLRALGGSIEHVQYLEPAKLDAPSLAPSVAAVDDDS